MEERFALDTRDRRRLLLAMMAALAAADSRISFEGNLSAELGQFQDISAAEDAVLRRATLQPGLDFVVLPLTTESLPGIKKTIVSRIAFGERGIVHVQIERGGKVAFAAYDNFNRECVIAFSPVSAALLDELTRVGILRTYTHVPRSVDVR